ncbi:MAG: hypothetical protein ACJ78Q_04600 [Chloroflexia bacterium]
MAADTTAADKAAAPDTQPSESSTVRRGRGPQINPEARIAPTCMMWSIIIGMSTLVLIVLLWGIANIGTILK